MNNENILLVGCCRSGHNFVNDQIKYWDTENKYSIYPLDDFDPFTWEENKHLVVKNGQPIDLEKPTTTIIVTRGLLNWYASYLMWLTDKGTRPVNHRNLGTEMERWCSQVEYCEKIPRWIMPGNHISIQYEDFTTDPGERNTVAGFLNLEWNDNRIHKRAVQGRGSSFEGWLDVGSREATQHRYKHIYPERVRELFEKTLQAMTYAKMLYRQNWNIPKHELHYMDTGLIDN